MTASRELSNAFSTITQQAGFAVRSGQVQMAEAKELLTHPREARGEGIYVIVRLGYTMSGSMDDDPDGDDIDTPPAYRFDPTPTDG